MLTLITVNYNCAAKTIGLLRSLETQTSKSFDVIVVDNDSTPDDRALLGDYAATSQLRLDVIYSQTNRGFSGGNNLAIRKALAQKSTWLLLINPDTTVEPDFIASLPLDTPGLVGLPIREDTGVVYGGLVHWLRSTLPHSYKLQDTSYKLRYVIGAGILVHASVFDKVGFLDERYFLYFEDADFSIRTRRAGIPISFPTSPVVTHAVSQSTQHLGGPLLLRYHMRNALLFNWNNGPWWVTIALPFWSFFAIIKQFAKVVFMPSRRPQSRAIAAGIIDFYAKHFGKITSDRH